MCKQVVMELETRWRNKHGVSIIVWEVWCVNKEAFEAAEAKQIASAAEPAAEKTRAEKQSKVPEPAEEATVEIEAPLVVHPWALKRVPALKQCPLGYFLKEALERSMVQAATKLCGTTAEGADILLGIWLVTSDVAPGKSVQDNTTLTWDQVTYAGAVFVHLLRECNHPAWVPDGFLLMWARLSNFVEFHYHETLCHRLALVALEPLRRREAESRFAARIKSQTTEVRYSSNSTGQGAIRT
jgi:endonuclease/exonuclease/phosphatase (EEP) superfamily protein YafD